jgi:hypothetical protein
MKMGEGNQGQETIKESGRINYMSYWPEETNLQL